MKYHKGCFKPINKSKYLGDYSKIYYRSRLELMVFIWCDKNSGIQKWVSEEIIIPYRCPVDGKFHRYFVDLLIQFKNGKTVLIEIKPKRFTKPPERKKRSTKKLLRETADYARNLAKWEAASAFAKQNNITFEVWTEENLKNLGIM